MVTKGTSQLLSVRFVALFVVLVFHTPLVKAVIRPVNDDFAQATALPEIMLGTTITYSVTIATVEPFETNIINRNDASSSVWWKWTPKYSSETAVKSSVNLRIFCGSSSSTLQPVIVIKRDPPVGLVSDAYQGFTAEAGVTYWITPDSASGSWSINQLLQKVETSNACAEQPMILTLTTLEDLPPPTELHVTVLFPPQPGLLAWNPITNIDYTNITFGALGSWTSTTGGYFRLNVTATYASGEEWQHNFDFIVRAMNDDFAIATEIPPNTTSNIFRFRTDYASAEPNEPPFPGGAPTRSVWWRWQPDHSAAVRFSVERWAEPLPEDIIFRSAAPHPTEVFVGAAINDLARISHNDGRTALPYRGYTVLNAEAGKTYFIRVSEKTIWDSIADGGLRVEPADAPAEGLVNLSSVLSTVSPEGTPHVEILGTILDTNGAPAAVPGLMASYYFGDSLDAMHRLEPPGLVGDGAATEIGTIRGTFKQGITTINRLAGKEIYVQLRTWMGDSYEIARVTQQLIGRSTILRIKAGSELNGPAVLTGLGDMQLFAPPTFDPGRFSIEDKTASSWRLNGFPGTYIIETSDLIAPWTPIAVLNNATGSMTFIDSRAQKPDAAFYRSRLID